MPRHARIDTPGALHHVICRGIERRNIFKEYRSKPLSGKTRICFEKNLHVLLRLGVDSESLIAERVAEIFDIEKDQVLVAGKQPDRVRARGVPAYWAIRDLGLTATEVGTYLGLSKSDVSRATTRGQKLIVDQSLSLKD
jgi:hypothetical protein